MATFPTLNPSTRTFTPGEYPHRSFLALSGKQNRVRNSNVMLGSQLRLSFLAITESQMLSILSHYQGQRGSFQSFALPSLVWNGTSNVSDYQLQGYGWIYKEPPTVADAMCADAYDVDLTLETVPPEGTAILGLEQLVRISLAPGVAFAVNSVTLTVTWTLSPGSAGYPGLDETVTASLAAGTATAGVTAAGLDFAIIAVLSKGPDALGLASTVTASLSGGTPSGNDPLISSVSILARFDGTDNSTTITDSSPRNLTMTAYGNARIKTDQFKFGGSSGYFDGTGDYVEVTGWADEFYFGSGNFTVEAWVRFAASPNLRNIVGLWPTSPCWRLYVNNSQKLSFLWYTSTNSLTSFESTGTTIAVSTWYHVAAVRNGNTLALYVDGVSSGSTSITGAVRDSGTILDIGKNIGGQSAMNGHIDDLRITKAARYTSNFTPPAFTFPNA